MVAVRGIEILNGRQSHWEKKQQPRKRECNVHTQKIYVKVKVHKNTDCFVVWFMIIILLLFFFSSFYSFTWFFSFSCLLFLFFRSKYFKISLMKQLPFSHSFLHRSFFPLLFFVIFQISSFLSSVNFYRIILIFLCDMIWHNGFFILWIFLWIYLFFWAPSDVLW